MQNDSQRIAILVVDDDESLRQILRLFLEAMFALPIHTAASGNDARHVISRHPEIRIVISDYNMPDGNGAELYQFIQSTHPELQFILCSTAHPADLEGFQEALIAGYVIKPNIDQGILDHVTRILKLIEREGDGDALLSGEELCPVPIGLLKQFGSIHADCFLKLSEDKYVRVLSRNDFFSAADYERFQSKGIPSLFIRKSEIAHFLNRLCADVEALAEARNLSPTSIHHLGGDLLRTVRDLGRQLGFTPELQRVVRTNVQLVLANLELNSRFEDLLNQVLQHESGFIPSHSVCLAYVGCWLAKILGFGTGPDFHNIVLAALMHDCIIRQEREAYLERIHEFPLPPGVTQEHLRNFKLHPIEAAQLVGTMEGVSPDVIEMIACHHEKPDGSGFPNGLGHSSMSPLCTVFNLGHELVLFYFRNGKEVSFQHFLSQHEAQYSHGVFRKFLDILAAAANPVASSNDWTPPPKS